MIENHLLVCVTHLEGEFSGIFVMSKMVRRETVS